jgi:hypothetical protein
VRTLSAADLLDLADRAEGLHPVDRALAMLRAAMAECTWDELARLSLGERDALLLQLRRATFGEALSAYAECPACGERLEFSIDCGTLQAHEEPEDEAPLLGELACGDYRIGLRRLDSRDLAAIAGCADVEQARAVLLARCITRIDGPRELARAEDLPREALEQVLTAIERNDPPAEVLLDLTCPACRHAWQAQLDIGRFMWTEVGARARRLLGEVDAIARAYGWRESEILGLSERRRAAYVELALQGAAA